MASSFRANSVSRFRHTVRVVPLSAAVQDLRRDWFATSSMPRSERAVRARLCADAIYRSATGMLFSCLPGAFCSMCRSVFRTRNSVFFLFAANPGRGVQQCGSCQNRNDGSACHWFSPSRSEQTDAGGPRPSLLALLFALEQGAVMARVAGVLAGAALSVLVWTFLFQIAGAHVDHLRLYFWDLPRELGAERLQISTISAD